MDVGSIESLKNVKQLDSDFIHAFRNYHKFMGRYRKAKPHEQIGYQEEVLKWFLVMSSLMKKMTTKIIRHSTAIAHDLSKTIMHNPMHNAYQLMPSYKLLDQSLANIERDAHMEIKTSDAIRHVAREARHAIRNVHAKVEKDVVVYKHQMQKQVMQQNRMNRGV